MSVWDTLREAITGSVYPKICAGCGLRGIWICDLCAQTVPRLDEGLCDRCGSPRFGKLCEGCRDLPDSVSQARSIYPYTGWVIPAVQRLKYRGEWDRASQFGTEMASLIDDLGNVDGLVPVPIHEKRLRKRGYNQALLIANAMSAASGPLVLDVLARTRFTDAQVGKTRSQRMENVVGAFSVIDEPMVTGRRLAIVDDVRTSGATIGACAEALRDAGAVDVVAVTIALDLQPVELERWFQAVRTSGQSG